MPSPVFTSLMCPEFLGLLMDHLRVRGGPEYDCPQSPQGNPDTSIAVGQPVGAARPYSYEIGAVDAYVQQSDASMSSVNEGHSSGAGYLRCFNLVIWDSIPGALATRTKLVDVWIPYFYISKIVTTSAFALDGSKLTMSMTQGTPAA